jgi:hypothetical protein
MFSWTKRSDTKLSSSNKPSALKKNTGIKTKRNNRPKQGVTFSNKTHVRNQYESVNPETGEHQVNLNEYNANASKNDEMPGYSMASPKFVPHSKSSLVQASQINNSGWTRSIGSVGPNVNVNRLAAFRSKMFMKNRYGNAWVSAEARLENVYKAKNAAIDSAIAAYNKGMAELEAEFFQNNGIEAPSVLEKMIYAEVEKFVGKYSNYDLANFKYELETMALEKLTQLPAYIRLDFEDRAVALRKKLQKDTENANRYVAMAMNRIPVGKPYNKRVKRTLRNRLATANVISSMAPPDVSPVKTVTPKKKSFSFF